MTIVPESKGKDGAPPAYDDSSRPSASAERSRSSSTAERSHTPAVPANTEDRPPPTSGVEIASNGDVTCTDETINTDVNALYDFLLTQRSVPPRVICHIVGTHEETRLEEQVVEDTTVQNGDQHKQRSTAQPDPSTSEYDQEGPEDSDSSTKKSSPKKLSKAPMNKVPTSIGASSNDGGETRIRRTQTTKLVEKTVKMTGFELRIDLTQYLLCKPVIWTAEDEALVYRGATDKQRWLGLPGVDAARAREGEEVEIEDRELMRSSKALKKWVKDYVERKGPLKQWEWTKGVDGWDWEGLREAIKGVALRTGYAGEVKVTFDVSGRHVYVRPPGVWSSMYSNAFGHFLLWFSLIMPYLLCYYKPGRWALGGEVWYFRRGDVGVKEGAWFRTWESTIEQAVGHRMKINEVLKRPCSERSGARLAGYDIL